jgi:hypothetical protein
MLFNLGQTAPFITQIYDSRLAQTRFKVNESMERFELAY